MVYRARIKAEGSGMNEHENDMMDANDGVGLSYAGVVWLLLMLAMIGIWMAAWAVIFS